MKENRNQKVSNVEVEEDQSAINYEKIFKAVILNWQWFVLSVVVCLASAAIYLRYTKPVFQTKVKYLIKDDDSKQRVRASSALNATNLGFVTNSNGFDNELTILASASLAQQVVRDLKLYVIYNMEARVTSQELYLTQPISVDIDSKHLEDLQQPIKLTIVRSGSEYAVTGSYTYVPNDASKSPKEYTIDKKFTHFPATINTSVGLLSFNLNPGSPMPEGKELRVTINSPQKAALKYSSNMSVAAFSQTTTIADVTLNDQNPTRACDFLKQLAVCYNRQANDDKNEISMRTEKFINNRLEKINAELGLTEGQLESTKRQYGVVNQQMNSMQYLTNQDAYNQKLVEAETQIELMRSLSEYINEPSNKHQTLPSNVGLVDQATTSLIAHYNEVVMERNNLLRSASESSPSVAPLTAQLDELQASIRRALSQASHNLEIQRNNIAQQYAKYTGQVSSTPEQERILTQIGRQQEVKSGLYLMLLQKREENSISLAATADKGRIIDDPVVMGKVSPKSSIIMLIALLLGIAIPAGVLYILNFLRYKIEGYDDVAALTKLPIIADVAIASNQAKTKADIVVHENKNDMMEEVFRSMRTNLQFMLKDGQNVVMFTSTTSGEGKTFTAANLATSFALLDKKVILVGLDIRKPRLAELFEINDHHHGITNLLVHEHSTWDDVKEQICESGVNKNLQVLMAGPIPPNPAELLTRKSLDNIINILKEQYDYVIIDTAPVGLVTDTLQIGRVSDITVYVCRADYTQKSALGLVNGLSEENKLPNICISINGIDMSKKKYGYYYGYGHYGKYRKYGHYGHYGKYGSYGSYGGSYGHYGAYGSYGKSHYGNADDKSIKLK
jgi:tyrosine-protein kinase Etk/Wzc